MTREDWYQTRIKETCLKELDSLMYTLDFLINEKKYIKISDKTNLEDLSFLRYVISQDKDAEIEASHMMFIEDYFAGRLGETYTITPLLFQYKNRGYRTQLQKQNDDTRWSAILAAIISASLTAVLTTLLQVLVTN